MATCKEDERFLHKTTWFTFVACSPRGNLLTTSASVNFSACFARGPFETRHVWMPSLEGRGTFRFVWMAWTLIRSRGCVFRFSEARTKLKQTQALIRVTYKDREYVFKHLLIP